MRDFAAPIIGSYEDEAPALEISDTAISRLRKEAVDTITTGMLLSAPSELNLCEIVDTVVVPALKDARPTVKFSPLHHSTIYYYSNSSSH